MCLSLALAARPQGLPAQDSKGETDRLKAWLEAVEAHTPGDPGKLGLDLSVWAGPDLEGVVVEAKRRARIIAKLDARRANDLLLRGATLHADLAHLMPDEMTRRLPTQQGVYVVRDGRWQGLRYSSIHWGLGRSLVAGVVPTPSTDPAVLSWYQQTSADMLQLRALAEAVDHLGRARQLFPTDPSILFTSGVLHERFSSSSLQAAAMSLVEDNRGTSAVSNTRGELVRAERFFLGTLTSQPANIEARVRHGRILGELGRHEEAAAELRRAIEDGADGPLLFFAHLFLGRQEEALGHLQGARAAFERAAALYPQAQTPRLALSQIARRTGDRSKAQSELQVLANLPADERQRQDPWWTYYEAR